MTVQNACLIFILCFSGITGWLMLREPANISITSVAPSEVKEKPSEIQDAPKVSAPVSESIRSEREQLDQLIIPVLDFRDEPLNDVVHFLHLKTSEMEGTSRSYDFTVSSTLDVDQTISIYREDISFADALDLICEKAECRWEISDHQVVIIPIEE